jgi:VanZ family protein
MRTDRFVALVAASAIMLGVLLLRSAPIPTGWDKVAHFTTYAFITCLLWYGTAGRAPLAVLAAVFAFGAFDEVHQLFMPGRTAEVADFIADTLAASAVCGLLFLRRKLLCAELSRRSPAATSSPS